MLKHTDLRFPAHIRLCKIVRVHRLQVSHDLTLKQQKRHLMTAEVHETQNNISNY